jgi:hypothetical protein
MKESDRIEQLRSELSQDFHPFYKDFDNFLQRLKEELEKE